MEWIHILSLQFSMISKTICVKCCKDFLYTDSKTLMCIVGIIMGNLGLQYHNQHDLPSNYKMDVNLLIN